MLIKPTPDLRESDVTPRELYLRRREFIAAAGVTAAAVTAGVLAPGEARAQNPAAQKLANLKKSPFSTDEKLNAYQATSRPTTTTTSSVSTRPTRAATPTR